MPGEAMLRRAVLLWGLLAALALLAIAAGLASGSAAPQGLAAWDALFDRAATGHAIVVQLRLPRILSGFAVGALLALAGALLQVLLRNPLAEPYVLGLSGGAALGAIIAIALALPALMISGAAALGALLSIIGVFAVARREFSGHAPAGASERLLLSGVMFAALWGALIALGLSLSPEAKLQGMIFWLMGDLAGAGGSLAEGAGLFFILALILLLCLVLAPRLNLLARGEEMAAALGERVGPLKMQAMVLAALAAGVAVASAGPIGFVGLIAPHLVRRLCGNDQRLLLPACALAGGTLVVLADTLARCVIAPQQLPVGAVTAALGAPVFLMLLWRRNA